VIVWLVYHGDCNDEYMQGIFATEELAVKYVESRIDSSSFDYDKLNDGFWKSKKGSCKKHFTINDEEVIEE